MLTVRTRPSPAPVLDTRGPPEVEADESSYSSEVVGKFVSAEERAVRAEGALPEVEPSRRRAGAVRSRTVAPSWRWSAGSSWGL